MTWSKMKAVSAALFLTMLACAGAGLLAFPVPAEQPKGSDVMPRIATAPIDAHGDPLPPGALFRAGTVRLRHGGPVTAVAFSPNGKILASSSWDHTVRLWDRDTGKELHRLRGHTDAVFCLAFAPDGRTLASAGKDHTIRLWDAAAGKEVKQVGKPALDVDCLAFAPDGKSLAAGGRNEPIRIWDIATGKEVCTPEGQEPLVIFGGQFGNGPFPRGNGGLPLPNIGALTLAFAPDGKLLAGGNKDHTIRLWDTTTGKEVRRLQGHAKGVTSIAFAPDGKTLVSGSGEAAIRLWDVASGKELRQLKGHPSAVFALAFGPGGKVVGSGGEDGTVRLWNAATGEELCRRHAGGDHVYGIAFSPDGSALASAQAHHTVGLWSATSLQPLLPALQQAELVPFTFSPDGRSLVAVRPDGTICLCDPATGKETRRLGQHKGVIMSLVFSPDGKRLASGSWSDHTIRVWDVAGDKSPLELPGHTNAVRSIAFSPDGKTLASASYDKTLRLWDLGTGKELHRAAHEAYLSAALSPDGKILADSRYDGSIYLWETATGKEVGRIRTGVNGGTFCMAFSPDGRTLAVAGLTTAVRLYEVASGRLRNQLAVKQGSVHSLAFTADGRMLATGGGEALTQFRDVEEFRLSAAPRLSDYRVCLWDVATGKQVHSLEGHQGGIYGLAFSPGSRRLVSRSWDTTALVWDLPAIPESPARRRAPLTARELQDLWSTLGELDAERAYQALGRLAAVPDQAISFVAERMQRVDAVEPRRLVELIANLDSKTFAVRERAARELQRLGELAGEEVRMALEAQPSLETRRRLDDILSNLAGPLPSPERLQSLRALELLEKIGTPGARQVLDRLAGGTPSAWLTRQAEASVQRLTSRLPSSER
jgi:WD40 repeat protein